nr:hypothetical protein [Tanacetum cinerariifolium]
MYNNSIKCTNNSLIWNNKLLKYNQIKRHVDNKFDSYLKHLTFPPIRDKIQKFEKLIIDEQAILVDEDGNPMKKVEYSGDHDSEDERDSYGNGDYDEDPYDEVMYEGKKLSEEIETICDKLDIRVRGRKKHQFLVSFV